MKSMVYAWAALAWTPVAACWLAIMPRATKARGWHRCHALAPFIPIALYAVSASDALHAALDAWFCMSLVMAILLAATWLWGGLIRNHGVMDVVYPLAPLAGAATAMIVSDRPLSLRTGLLLALVSVWSVRLAVQTYGHNIRAEREPYATWRKRYGRDWRWWSFFQIYLLQGVMIWFWSVSLALAFTASATAIGWTTVLGTIVWLAGFALQTGADAQLTRFKRDPANRGQLLRDGLWSIVRHPNYLGESLMWWGYFVFALAHPWGVLAIISPLYVTWFMGYGSAARFKEQHMSRTRPAEWAEYVARTPRFFPWSQARATSGDGRRS